MVTMGQLPFTPRAKKVLELALEEASNLGHNYIGTVHSLLGLIRERDAKAAKGLTNLSVKLETLREEGLDFLGADVPQGEGGEKEQPATPAAQPAPSPSPSEHTEVLAAGGSDDALASTGSSPAVGLLAGAVLVLTGTALVLLRRRRSAA